LFARAGAAAAAINVGDIVGIASIPLPSRQMEKIKPLGELYDSRSLNPHREKPSARRCFTV
jgi:hypothetical protein